MISKNKEIDTWFKNVIILLSFLALFYVVLHLFINGKMYVKLTANEITDINLILNSDSLVSNSGVKAVAESLKEKAGNPDSLSDKNKQGKKVSTGALASTGKIKQGVTNTKKDEGIGQQAQDTAKVKPVVTSKNQSSASFDEKKKKMVIRYIFSKYKPAEKKNDQDSIFMVQYFTQLDLKTLSYIAGQYPIITKSYFWLIGGWVYLEILFWSLFGLICSLLYNVSEAVSQNKFKENEKPVHLAKLFYTPFIAFIVYLSFDILTLNKDINVSEYGTGMIVFAFILGFFSRRAIDLLDRIKEIILPGKSKDTAETDVDVTNPATAEIIEEAIRTKGEEWVNSFPNVTGLSVSHSDPSLNQAAEATLSFKVLKKDAKITVGKIPKSIPFKASDGKVYNILTDVIQESNPKSHLVIQDSAPFELGISISRENEMETGTVGLLLNKRGITDKHYIISCYHVFCAPELKKNNRTFSPGTKPVMVRCASFEDDGTNKVGNILMGQLDKESDFAIAELHKDDVFKNNLFKQSIIPKGFLTVVPGDIGKTVKMCGRTSGFKTGKIKGHYASQTILYGNDVSQYITGLVEIEPISKGGDSGAAVLDYNNKVIGLIVSGTELSSYVLPVYDYLDNNDFELV